MNPEIKIDGRKIGVDHPPYIIAEMSANHNGSIDRAINIIEAAKESGADAVKIQTFTADTITIDFNSSDFIIKSGLWKDKNLYDLYNEAHTPWEWHEKLVAKAKEIEISLFSSPFDFSAVNFLETLNIPAYKISSFEIVDIPLIERVSATGKPLIISTGMASLNEITLAVETASNSNLKDLALLHCVSGYPTPAKDAHIKNIPDLYNRFEVVVGLSDHTIGNTVAISAIANGASIIEKHFTLSREDGGLDSVFSLEPNELKQLCDDSRITWEANSDVDYSLKESEKDNLNLRRSLYVVKDIKSGELFSNDNIRSIRPGFGMSPKYLNEVIGLTALKNIKRGSILTKSLIKDFDN